MKLSRAVISLLLITIVYVLSLSLLDTRNQVFGNLPRLWKAFPILLLLTLGSILLRYMRWQGLLRYAGHRVPIVAGGLSYLTGFAFTATPGKVGELVRLRYFFRFGVPQETVIACFVFERGLDLLVVILLGLFVVDRFTGFGWIMVFVGVVLGSVALVMRRPTLLLAPVRWAELRGWKQLSKLLHLLAHGMGGIAPFLRWPVLLPGFAAGLAAWALIAFSFQYLLAFLDIVLPWQASFSIYPVAMLAGAASFLPGGLGSTEAAVVLLLHQFGIGLQIAAVAAIGIRLANLWFAIILGIGAATYLETRTEVPS